MPSFTAVPASVHESPEEVERIRTVYAAYDRSEAVQRRWDPRNPGNQAIERERFHRMRELLGRAGRLPVAGQAILEIGCGRGDVLASMIELGARPDDLYGVDLLPNRIEPARQRFPAAHLDCANAEQLGYASDRFSMVLLFTVFSSIRRGGMTWRLAREVERVLRPGGAVLWYELRRSNPWNREVRAISQAELRELFPTFSQHLRSVTVLPQLARRLGRHAAAVYPLLAVQPWLRTHWMGLLIKPELNRSGHLRGEGGGTDA